MMNAGSGRGNGGRGYGREERQEDVTEFEGGLKGRCFSKNSRVC
jgi:hypothetical protein